MKYIALIIGMFLSANVMGDQKLSPEYVSIECPQGDITLFLGKQGEYLLELRHWSQKQKRHTHSEAISGTWIYRGDELVLDGEKKIVYKRSKADIRIGSTEAKIDSFIWVRSSESTFADS